jgi:hypothetical protein
MGGKPRSASNSLGERTSDTDAGLPVTSKKLRTKSESSSHDVEEQILYRHVVTRLKSPVTLGTQMNGPDTSACARLRQNDIYCSHKKSEPALTSPGAYFWSIARKKACPTAVIGSSITMPIGMTDATSVSVRFRNRFSREERLCPRAPLWRRPSATATSLPRSFVPRQASCVPSRKRLKQNKRDKEWCRIAIKSWTYTPVLRPMQNHSSIKMTDVEDQRFSKAQASSFARRPEHIGYSLQVIHRRSSQSASRTQANSHSW